MFRNYSSSIHNLKVQVGQLANSLSSRNQGALPSNTEKNSKEYVKIITLRSGTELQLPKKSAPTSSNKEENKVGKEIEHIEE